MDVAVPVRWQDLDALGHVGHTLYLTYFEEQRDHWLHQRIGLGGRDYVVASAQVDYESAVTLEDGPVVVSARIEQMGRSSLILVGELRSTRGHICARSRTTIVLWDQVQHRSRPLTGQERALLSTDVLGERAAVTDHAGVSASGHPR